MGQERSDVRSEPQRRSDVDRIEGAQPGLTGRTGQCRKLGIELDDCEHREDPVWVGAGIRPDDRLHDLDRRDPVAHPKHGYALARASSSVARAPGATRTTSRPSASTSLRLAGAAYL